MRAVCAWITKLHGIHKEARQQQGKEELFALMGALAKFAGTYEADVSTRRH